MEVVVDTSVIVAVLVGEAHRGALLQATESADLLAPPSVHWEVGNAFSAMFKRRRLTLRAARRAIQAYQRIPIRFSDIDLDRALEVARDLDLYAYDTYVIVCAMQHRCALLSLDQGLVAAAAGLGIRALEIGS
jgi:predicted nucleic acid-binding protein